MLFIPTAVDQHLDKKKKSCLHGSEFRFCVPVMPQHRGALLLDVRPVGVDLIGRHDNKLDNLIGPTIEPPNRRCGFALRESVFGLDGIEPAKGMKKYYQRMMWRRPP